MLIERFLERHRGQRTGACLEVGPGAGRFSLDLATRYEDVVFLDLSRAMLAACRRTLGRAGRGPDAEFVEGSLEALPFLPGSFDRVVALGVLPFVAQRFPTVLRELGNLLKAEGRLIFEIQSASQTTMTLLPRNPPGARRILRRPKEHHVWDVVRDGYQPWDPVHLARFECVWRRPHELFREVRAAKLRIVDIMAIAPNFGNQPDLLGTLRRDRAAYATALRLEEEMGRWPELLGAGAGTLVAAVPLAA